MYIVLMVVMARSRRFNHDIVMYLIFWSMFCKPVLYRLCIQCHVNCYCCCFLCVSCTRLLIKSSLKKMDRKQIEVLFLFGAVGVSIGYVACNSWVLLYVGPNSFSHQHLDPEMKKAASPVLHQFQSASSSSSTEVAVPTSWSGHFPIANQSALKTQCYLTSR